MTDVDRSGDDLTWFWGIVERSHQDRDQLRSILSQLSKEQIYTFQDTFVEMAAELQDEPYSMHIAPDESEDGLADISHWVVSQGEDFYDRVLDDPEQMPAHVDVGDPGNLFDVAYDVYFGRFNEPLEVM